MVDLVQLEHDIQKLMSEYRFKHSLSVLQVAKKLAKKYNLNPDDAAIAALAHDMTKETNDAWDVAKMKAIGIYEESILSIPGLWHGFTAAYVLETKYNVQNQDILDAVRYHTIGNVKMGDLAKIVYIADHVDPSRLESTSAVNIDDDIDLDELFIKVAVEKAKIIKDSGLVLHPYTVEMLQKFNKLS